MPQLNDIKIRNARLPPEKKEDLLSDGNDLFLRLRRKGRNGHSRTWLVRIKRNGKRRVHTLGAWPDVSIKEARAKAARLVSIERGTARVTVAEAVEQFMDSQIRPRYRSVANAEVYCKAVKTALGALAVDALRPFDVSRMVLDYKRTAPVAAMRLFAFTKGFLSWCIGIGYATHSPAADLKASAFGVKEMSRERMLTDDEIRAFWHATDLQHVPLLRFLLLTGLRIQEAQCAAHGDIDVEHWLTVPADRAKNGKEHRAYLPEFARQQIEAKPLLFRSVSPTAVQAALHRWQDKHGIAERWTPHDLRRTFASRCGDLGVAPHVIAKLLNHTIPGGGSLPVYLRTEWLDERKSAAEALASHVEAAVSGCPK
jgi:integrase